MDSKFKGMGFERIYKWGFNFNNRIIGIRNFKTMMILQTKHNKTASLIHNGKKIKRNENWNSTYIIFYS